MKFFIRSNFVVEWIKNLVDRNNSIWKENVVWNLSGKSLNVTKLRVDNIQILNLIIPNKYYHIKKIFKVQLY